VLVELHLPPLQQGCPASPHGTQVLEVPQASPGSLQKSPPPSSEDRQQGAPALPQGTHTEVPTPSGPEHARSKLAHAVSAGKVPRGQQGSPALPQAQRPDVQVP
jgi:hypothetical protein